MSPEKTNARGGNLEHPSHQCSVDDAEHSGPGALSVPTVPMLTMAEKLDEDWTSTAPVVGFDADGHGWVATYGEGRLVRADRWAQRIGSRLAGYVEDDDRIVAAFGVRGLQERGARAVLGVGVTAGGDLRHVVLRRGTLWWGDDPDLPPR